MDRLADQEKLLPYFKAGVFSVYSKSKE